MSGFGQSTVESASLSWFESLRYQVLPGTAVSLAESPAERSSYADVILARRLREAIARLNASVPSPAQEDALRKVTQRSSPSLVVDNRHFHRMLVGGVAVEFESADGRIVGDRVHLVDFEDVAANDWLVVFVNGPPLAIFELKDATIWSAFNDHQTKKQDIS